MTTYDLIVIGGGSAGGSCAEAVNKAGKRVALIERDALGGTCLNYGCDPTKTALHTAKLLYQAQNGAQHGLVAEEVSADWPKILARIQAVQKQMRGGSREEAREQMRERGISLIMGEGRFVSPKEIAVRDQILTAAQFVIATGTEPAVPDDIPGLAESGYLTNKTAFALQQLPRRLAILGGGPNGVEFAQLFARLGVDVTLVEMEPHILPKDDAALAAELEDILRSEGIEIYTEAALTAVSAEDGAKQLTLSMAGDREEMLVVDDLLVAVGRRAAVDTLNLEVAGVSVRDGKIDVEASLRTSQPHIWAAGDVATDYKFTHVAWRQGAHVAENILDGQTRPFAQNPIPWVTYTDPELAHVGQTEAELKEKGVVYRALEQPLTNVARAIATGQSAGRVKLLVDEHDRILGGHILAAGAGELIGPVLLAMQAGISVKHLAETVWPYPTMSTALGKAARE